MYENPKEKTKYYWKISGVSLSVPMNPFEIFKEFLKSSMKICLSITFTTKIWIMKNY